MDKPIREQWAKDKQSTGKNDIAHVTTASRKP